MRRKEGGFEGSGEVKGRQLRLVSWMEKASKSLHKVHQTAAFRLAILKRSNQLDKLSFLHLSNFLCTLSLAAKRKPVLGSPSMEAHKIKKASFPRCNPSFQPYTSAHPLPH